MTRGFWIALIFLGLAVSLFEIIVTQHERHRVDSDVADLNGKLAHLRDATARTRTSLDATEKQLAETPKKMPAPDASPVDARGVTPVATPTDDGLILTRHPALRAKFERSIRGDLQDRYAAFFQRWKLSEEKTEKLLRLLVHDAESELDLQGAAAARGVNLDAPGGAGLRAKQWADLLAAEAALLKPEEYQMLQQLQRVDGVRPAVEELAESALFSGAFSAVQIQQLMQVMAECSPEYRAGGRAVPDTINWDEALARAAAFLPDAQFAGLRAYARVIQRVQRVGDIRLQAPEPAMPRK